MKRAIPVLLLLGCGGADEPSSVLERDETASPREESAPTPEEQEPATAAELTASNAGGFHARWEPAEGEVPLNEEWTAEVWLYEDAAGERPLEDADVSIDCRMPAHRHGMLQEVELVHLEDGHYRAEGMLCHMLGHWELYVDLTRGPITERVQWDLDLR